MTDELNYLERGITSLNLSFDKVIFDRLLYYKKLVLEANQNLNLTSVTDDKKFIELHIIDSLSICHMLKGSEKFIDIGSGAGFPGVILKIIHPALDLTVLDSLKKRLIFVENAAKTIGLDDINFAHARAEDASHTEEFREKFDAATARAVAPLAQLCEYCIPYVRKGGRFIAMKGSSADDELQKAGKTHSILGCDTPQISRLELFDSGAQRSILVYNKISYTPPEYPRKQGLIKKYPLF